MRGTLSTVLALAATLSAPATALAAESPQDLVVDTTREVLQILRDNRQRVVGDPAYVRGLVNEKIVPHLDFEIMTRLAVGKYWNDASASQRATLVEEFRALLLHTYSKSLGEYKDQRIDFRPFQPEARDDRAVVRSQFQGDAGQPVPVDYKLRRTDGWKIYDITIDGISLVTNYRASFGAELEKGGVASLIASLQRKNAELGP